MGRSITNVARPPLSIGVRVYSGVTTLMYTVPTGRKWIGRLGAQTAGSVILITPSGSTVGHSNSVYLYGTFFHQNTSGNYAVADLVTIHAGGMIHTDNNGGNRNWMIQGEETDA